MLSEYVLTRYFPKKKFHTFVSTLSKRTPRKEIGYFKARASTMTQLWAVMAFAMVIQYLLREVAAHAYFHYLTFVRAYDHYYSK